MKKEFYDDGKNKVIFNVNSEFDSGLCGSIYLLDNDSCLKEFTRNTKKIVNLRAFKTIIDMNLDNFYKVYKLLYDENGIFSGYTMKYYKKEDYSILEMPMEYTLNNFNSILNVSSKISDKGIVMEDLHNENVILQKDKIIIIDADMYGFIDQYVDATNNLVLLQNKIYVYELFRKLFMDSLKKINNLSFDKYFDYSQNIYNLFQHSNSCDTIIKKLVKYKYPIDCIKNEK